MRGKRPVSRPSNEVKASSEWQLARWTQWPREEDWPGLLDIFEAAAFCRVHPDTIRAAVRPGRDGKAPLAHQRWGAAYRIRKVDLVNHRRVKERVLA